MKKLATEIIIILALALVAGIINNALSHSRVSWIGEWPSISDAEEDSTWNCLSCDSTDPPMLSLSEASALYQNPEVVFIDARFPEEYDDGHIAGAHLLSIEESDDVFDQQYEDLLNYIDTSTHIVTYCSGEECESSLFLARYLRDDAGFKHVKIFFGGWRRWYNAGLPVDTGETP
jgi:rhodanese-related sulfurtransferase